ncbi:MAG: flagellar type III secretion system protein FlhB [Albidovulum sp.]
MSEDDDTEKSHEPSQKKLDDARERGELVRSTDLTMAAGFCGFLLAALTLGPAAMLGFGDRAKAYLDQVDLMQGGGGSWGGFGWTLAICLPVLPFFILPGSAALCCLMAQRALVFSGEKLAPKLSRISLIANAGNKFGRSGLFEFAKSAVKMLLTGLLVGYFLVSKLPEIILSLQLPAAPISALLMQLLVEFLILVVLAMCCIGGLDYFWQHFEHLRRNRMSRQEMVDEHKQSEGDPHMKGQRRQRAQAIAMNQMLADVPKADVIIVNPTHYAVALKWNRQSGRAPICLAKGVDEVAARIRESAASAGVPIHSDPPTARALYAGVNIGEEIRTEHYAPVAAAIRFGEKMRQRARERRGR